MVGVAGKMDPNLLRMARDDLARTFAEARHSSNALTSRGTGEYAGREVS